MKRILCSLLLMVVMISIPAVAYGESIDLSRLSTDELLALRAEVEAEIAARITTDRYEIFNGDYIVGEHIKPGRYVLTVVEMFKLERSSSGWVNVVLRNTEDSTKIDSLIMVEGMSQILDLSQGMTLHLDGLISATLEPADIYAYTPEKG